MSFYDVYLKTFRAFGTPPYGRSYFSGIWNGMAGNDEVKIFIAEREGKTLGALLLFCWNKVAVSKFAVALPERQGLE